MPKDTWRKANDRARYGPAQAKRTSRTGKGKTHLAPAAGRRHHRRRRPAGPGAYSGSTVLWFGRHKDKPVREVPTDYLRWLAAQHSTSPNVAALAAWLRRVYIPSLDNAQAECPL
jgi:hypothetical protein